MTMEVSFKTKVEHPEEERAVCNHDSPMAVNFGCSENWFNEGEEASGSELRSSDSASPQVA